MCIGRRFLVVEGIIGGEYDDGIDICRRDRHKDEYKV